MGISDREIEEKYLDVMQNIEAVIVNCYRYNESLSDLSVMSVMEALINRYTAEITERQPKPVKFSELEQRLFEEVKEICEWRLGRGTLKEHPELSEIIEDKKKRRRNPDHSKKVIEIGQILVQRTGPPGLFELYQPVFMKSNTGKGRL